MFRVSIHSYWSETVQYFKIHVLYKGFQQSPNAYDYDLLGALETKLGHTNLIRISSLM